MKTLKIIRSPFMQRGSGLGGIFRSLARIFMPIAKTAIKASKPLMKQAAKETGKELLRSGIETVGDLAAGENLGASVKKNLKAGTKRI